MVLVYVPISQVVLIYQASVWIDNVNTSLDPAKLARGNANVRWYVYATISLYNVY
jgi:hypothetical protein